MFNKILVVLFATALVAGCGSSYDPSASKVASKPAAKKVVAPLMPSAYGEFFHNGRYYIVGNSESAAKFKEMNHLPLTRTLFGAGPHGETVIFEVVKGETRYTDELVDEFFKRHPFYSEVEHNSRVYVLGQFTMWEDLLANGDIPFTKNFIGEGPGGKTLVFENLKSGSHLTKRLIAEYNRRHRSNLKFQ